MSEIILQQKDGYLVALIAHDGSDWQKVQVDSRGRLQIDAIVQSKDGDKILSFESVVVDAAFELSLDSGSNLIDAPAVGSGKMWKITNACFMYFGTAPSRMRLLNITSSVNFNLLDEYSISSEHWYFWRGELYMEAGDFLRLAISGAAENADAHLQFSGVQMNAP